MKTRVLFQFLSVTFLAMNLGLSASIDESKIIDKESPDIQILEKNPLKLLSNLIDEDAKKESLNVYKGSNFAFVLSSANKKGAVSSRLMYVNKIGLNDIYFATTKTSNFTQHIIENNQAAATFFLSDSQQALSFMGKVEPLSKEETDEYFKKLDKDSQLMYSIVAPVRSQPMERQDYEISFNQAKDSTQDSQVAMPPEFIVYKFTPNAVSYVKEVPHGHSRNYYLKDDQGKWTVTSMTP
jgi:pyridoxine/pyridoxamine 5'-phosphate oxidase